jgi:hypothetical protein
VIVSEHLEVNVTELLLKELDITIGSQAHCRPPLGRLVWARREVFEPRCNLCPDADGLAHRTGRLTAQD